MIDLSNIVKNTLFPKYCFGCNRLGTYICDGCVKKLLVVALDVCPYCQRASWFGLTHPSCRRKCGLDGIKSIYRYTPLLQKIIKNIKYHGVSEAVADILATIPAAKRAEWRFYRNFSSHFTIVPVPLYSKRYKVRGFNQAFLLGTLLAREMGFTISDRLITRIKNTPPQAMLTSPQARYENVRAAFAINSSATAEMKDISYIIIDDVWTTGSTVKEIGRVLKRGGAKHVFALTLAC